MVAYRSKYRRWTNKFETAAMGAATDSITDFTAAGKTSGIGILKKTGSAVLKAKLLRLKKGWENYFKSKSIYIRQPSTALHKVKKYLMLQAHPRARTPHLRKLLLKMTVTPSIIGDGNVLLDIK